MIPYMSIIDSKALMSILREILAIIITHYKAYREFNMGNPIWAMFGPEWSTSSDSREMAICIQKGIVKRSLYAELERNSSGGFFVNCKYI